MEKECRIYSVSAIYESWFTIYRNLAFYQMRCVNFASDATVCTTDTSADPGVVQDCPTSKQNRTTNLNGMIAHVCL